MLLPPKSTPSGLTALSRVMTDTGRRLRKMEESPGPAPGLEMTLWSAGEFPDA